MTLRILHLLLQITITSICLTSVALGQDVDRKGSPFEALRWQDASPEVFIDGEWYQPISIQGVQVSGILLFCDKRWPGQRQKRFGEDLIEAMVLMGHEPPNEVDLELVRIDDGMVVKLSSIGLSEANRNTIRDQSSLDDRLEESRAPPITLTGEQAREDLQAFATALTDQFAYLELRNTDWQSSLKEIRDDLPRQVPSAYLAKDLNQVMARFGDGHARVSSFHKPRPERYPPFLLEQSGEGVVAFQADRSGFLENQHPYILAIDGLSIDEWVDLVVPNVTAGSPQLVRSRALRALRLLELWRPDADQPASKQVKVTLAENPKGKGRIELELPMTPRRPTYGEWPRTESRILAGKIGYLRLPAMQDELVPHLHSEMQRFQETKGLIVDVRGNGGGSRSLLLALAGYLVGPDEKPWVGNVAKYRESPRFDANHLEARYMYRATDDHWSDRQLQAIGKLARRFKPEWTPAEGFSDWHYLVLDRTGHQSEYFYDKSVVVLADSHCFSATDIFLGALSGHPRVTLMGSPSAGGSARSQRSLLPHSEIEVRCASMASFRPDGRLYDGRGIEVDIEVPTQPEDFLINGTDTVLDAALERLGQGSRSLPTY